MGKKKEWNKKGKSFNLRRSKMETTIGVTLTQYEIENNEDVETVRNREFTEIDNALDFIREKLKEAISQDYIIQFSAKIIMHETEEE